jgi:hypothetical protein
MWLNDIVVKVINMNVPALKWMKMTINKYTKIFIISLVLWLRFL